MARNWLEKRRTEMERDEAALRRDERNVARMEREQAIREREADVFAAARRRRLESQNLTALADPGRYAPQVYKQARQWRDNDDLREHERQMLEQQGENELKVAEQKRFGMREQGMGAAEINANASITNTEREWAGRERIAKQQGEDARKGEEIRGKNALDVETQRGKNALTVEQQRGKDALGIEQQRGKDALGVEQARGAASVAAAEAQARIAAAQQEQKRTMTEAQESKAATDLMRRTARKTTKGYEPTMTYEQALKQIREQGRGKKVRSYRFNADRTKRIPVYEDGSQGPAEDAK